MKQHGKCLLVGMSHVEAVERAYNSSSAQSPINLDVINLGQTPKYYNTKTNELSYDGLRRLKPDFVFLSIGGNFHNIFGIVENPVRYSVGERSLGAVPEGEDRHFIPSGMMRAHFKSRLDGRFFHHIANLKKAFGDIPVAHICSPPPMTDTDHILKYPGVFRPKLALGISPVSLRLKLYAIHTELYRETCIENGIAFIDPPSEALDGAGGLERAFYNNDPTHGNEQYGAAVLRQMEAFLERKNEAA